MEVFQFLHLYLSGTYIFTCPDKVFLTTNNNTVNQPQDQREFKDGKIG